MLRPALAHQLLVAPARGGLSTVTLTILGGQTVTTPAGRLRSMRVGSLVVEDLDVAIYDALPARQDVHGLLGGDFLRNFRVTVDRGRKRLLCHSPADRTPRCQARSNSLRAAVDSDDGGVDPRRRST